jgi:hypothetical protein
VVRRHLRTRREATVGNPDVNGSTSPIRRGYQVAFDLKQDNWTLILLLRVVFFPPRKDDL